MAIKQFEYKKHHVRIGADNPDVKNEPWKKWIEIDGVRQVPPDSSEGYATHEIALIVAEDSAKQMIDAGQFLKSSD